LVDIRRLERKLKINERFLNFLTNKEQEYRDLILAHSHQRPSAVHNTREALDEAVLHLGKNSKKFFARYAFMQEQKRRNTNPLSEWDVKHDRFNQTLLRIQDRISRMDNPNELRREILSHRLRLGGHYKKIQQIENRPWINDRANTEERLSRTPDREERDAEKYHNERKISTLKAKVGQSESSSRVKFTSGDPVWKTVLRYRNP
jgi:hypothetical protein